MNERDLTDRRFGADPRTATGVAIAQRRTEAAASGVDHGTESVSSRPVSFAHSTMSAFRHTRPIARSAAALGKPGDRESLSTRWRLKPSSSAISTVLRISTPPNLPVAFQQHPPVGCCFRATEEMVPAVRQHPGTRPDLLRRTDVMNLPSPLAPKRARKSRGITRSIAPTAVTR